LNVSRRPNPRALIVTQLIDGRERSSREVARDLGFGLDVTNATILRVWHKGEVPRARKPTFEEIEVPRGRLGIRCNFRACHKYAIPVTYAKNESFVKEAQEYVAYARDKFDHRFTGEKSFARNVRISRSGRSAPFLLKSLKNRLYIVLRIAPNG
jgi:hypothetical protein